MENAEKNLKQSQGVLERRCAKCESQAGLLACHGASQTSSFGKTFCALFDRVAAGRQLPALGWDEIECCVWFEIEFLGGSCQLSISETCVSM